MNPFKSLAIIFLLLPTFLLAEEEQIRVAIGSRPINEEAASQMENQKGHAEEITEDTEGQTAGYIFDHYPPVYYSNSYHTLCAVVIRDNSQYTIELEDGSVWKINTYDGEKALSWYANSALIITQNNRWFSKYNYRIINKTNGSSVEANLFLGPVEHGHYSRFVIGIDHLKREIMLSDNSHWEISYLDNAIFRDWALNDYVIIGTNSNTSFWDSSSDALLINVNMNTCVRAKQF